MKRSGILGVLVGFVTYLDWWLRQLWSLVEELYYNLKFYKYEMYVPDWEKERKEGLEESYRRIRKLR